MNNEKNSMFVEHSENIGSIAAALAKAQGDMSVLPMNKKAKIKGTSKNGVVFEYEYNYSDLAEVVAELKKVFPSNGLSFSQIPTSYNGKSSLMTLIMHESGQWLKGYIPILENLSDPQKMGSLLTYLKRYSLTGMTGIVADKDDDGGAANLAREEQEQIRKQEEDRKKERNLEQKRLQSCEYSTRIELAMENCSTQDELKSIITNEFQKQLVWIKLNDSKQYAELIKKKDEHKKRLGGS